LFTDIFNCYDGTTYRETGLLIKNELEMILKEVVLTEFNVVIQNLGGAIVEKKPQSIWSNSGLPEYEPGAL
jgi:hypothetical protein